MNSDPIIDELHKIREEHLAEFNNDVDLLYDYWLNKPKDKNRNYVNFERKAVKEHLIASDNKTQYEI